MRSASIAGTWSAAAARSSPVVAAGGSRLEASVCVMVASSEEEGKRPCSSKCTASSKSARGARSSSAYPAMMSRPASPSTWLSRVEVATTPSRPCAMSTIVGVDIHIVNIDNIINIYCCMSTTPSYLTAAEATHALGVTRATLYAYASRGHITSEPVPGRPRERRYRREDVERLGQRKEARRDPDAAAARALHWGGPVCESGITLIDDGVFYYRGHDALALAETATVEQAAALLWEADEVERKALFAQPCPLTRDEVSRLRAHAADPLRLCQMVLPVAAVADPAAFDVRPKAVRRTGARIVKLLTVAITGRTADDPVHRALQAAWAPTASDAGDTLRTALVLLADHELNVSAFSARCAASAGASPYDVVSAALATLKGYKHGGAAERVGDLLAKSGTERSARAALAEQLRRGDGVAGFGHPLYPAGDPRATPLLRLAVAAGSRTERRRLANLLKASKTVLHERPTVDVGLVALARAYGLPEQAPLLIFALARSVGWLAHAMEEYASGRLIRPRARYVGPMPEGTTPTRSPGGP
jgi:citrate synthase